MLPVEVYDASLWDRKKKTIIIYNWEREKSKSFTFKLYILIYNIQVYDLRRSVSKMGNK